MKERIGAYLRTWQLQHPLFRLIWDRRRFAARSVLVLFILASLTGGDWWAASRQPARLRWYASATREIRAGTPLTAKDIRTGFGRFPPNLVLAPADRVVDAFALRLLEAEKVVTRDDIGPEPILAPKEGECFVPVGLTGSGTALIRPGMWVALRKDKQSEVLRLAPAKVVAVTRTATANSAVVVVALPEPPGDLDGWVAAIVPEPAKKDVKPANAQPSS